ncbi:MAG: tetratricopeptide repeat protein [Chthoniobacter sp.]|nr:tetratricopeptide repeat protein [Chthoniobacter sp.]
MSDAFGLRPQIMRGLQLRDLGRYADAENCFREALAQEPNDAFALHQLAACQLQLPKRQSDALATIDRAIGLEPNDAEHHVLRSYILSIIDRPKDGLLAAQTALGLDPHSSIAFTAQAQAHLQMEQWPAAEQSARQALALDADNSSAANQLAQALRLQNKLAENASHLAGMLARDPEDAFTHANAGWAALQRGQHRAAEEHFREALRIDPDFDYARHGLLESYRARSPIYRAYLRYCFFMQRLSSGSRWAVIIGLYIGSRVARAIPGGFAFVALYMLFVLWVWVAKPVGNFFLLFDSFARYALRPDEKREAAAVGGALALGLVVLLGTFVLRWPHTMPLGIGLIAAAFPLALTFTNGARFGTWLFGSIATLTILGAALSALAGHVPLIDAEAAMQIFIAGIIGCIATTWIGNIPFLRRPPE